MRRTWFAFFTVVAAWGSSYLFIRLALGSFTPFGLVAIRCVVASMICLAMARLRGDVFPRGWQLARFALVGVLLMSGSNALTAFAQRTVASGITGVVHSLGSVWLAALGSLGWWDPAAPRTPVRAWWGVAGGVLGVALLLWPDREGVHADAWGIAALLVATFFFAGGSLVQKRAQSLRPVGLFAQICVQMAAGSAAAASLALLSGVGFVHAQVTVSSLSAMVVLSTVASVGGFVAYAMVVRDWPAARAGSFGVVNPLVSVLLGVALLNEPLTARMLSGMAVILVSVVWVQTTRARSVEAKIEPSLGDGAL